MTCIPYGMIWSHVIFPISVECWTDCYEWWATPIAIPTENRIWCIWRLGFWWTTIRYGDIKKAVFAQWMNSAPSFAVVYGEDKRVVLGTLYSFRELSKIKDAVLHNWCAATGKRLQRQELGRESVIWTLGEDGEMDVDGGEA